MRRVDCRGGGDGGGSKCNGMQPKPLDGDFLFPPLFFGLPTLRGDTLFGALFSLEQKDAPPPPRALAIVMPAALSGAIPFLHALHKKQRLLFFAESLVSSHRWHCHEAMMVEADLGVLDILQRIRSGGSVAANIDYSLVSKRCYSFLQLQVGSTDLFMIVPRNDAIFPKLHTNRY